MIRRGARRVRLPWYCAAIGGVLCAIGLHSPDLLRAQMPTAERLLYRGWWPRHSVRSDDTYVGPAECAACHPQKAATQKDTPMARTAIILGAEPDILATHGRLTFQSGSIGYQIAMSDGKPVYTVTDGTRSLSARFKWSFGDGHVGQSYLFEQDGKLYESRVSYFNTLQGLGFTPGRELSHPHDLEEAMARPVDGEEQLRCFSCHTTGSTINDKLESTRLIPGITCEGCHGPGFTHVVAQKMTYLQGQPWETGQEADLIFDPGKLSPVDAVDFCGSCHGTWWDVKLGGIEGIGNIRAQPYRLEKSRCWGKKGDARLTCVACHDPHKALVRDSLSYDRNCLGCHLAGDSSSPTPDHPGPACKVSTKNCASCHMPKFEDPATHYTFTDHFIRIVRPGAPYPD
jgi:predicted CXXCH cytochrome family protein